LIEVAVQFRPYSRRWPAGQLRPAGQRKAARRSLGEGGLFHNNGQFPTNFADAAPFLEDAAKNQTKVFSDEFEIVFTGSSSSITNPQDVVMLREKDAYSTASTADPRRGWAKIYGFVDGHVIVHSEPENDFTAFENAHIIAPSANP